jgi:hypothetical protein
MYKLLNKYLFRSFVLAHSFSLFSHTMYPAYSDYGLPE